MLEFAIDDAVLATYGVAASGTDPDGALSGPGVAWDLPEGGWSAARTIWAITAKSELVVLVSLRPEDSREHGEETAAARRASSPGTSRSPTPSRCSRPSTTRPAPTRGRRSSSGRRTTTPRARRRPRIAGGAIATPYGRLAAARFAWSFRGTPAVGGYEIFTGP